MENDGTVKIGTDIDESGFKSGLSKLGGVAKTALKGTVAAIGGVATAATGAVTGLLALDLDLNQSPRRSVTFIRFWGIQTQPPKLPSFWQSWRRMKRMYPHGPISPLACSAPSVILSPLRG